MLMRRWHLLWAAACAWAPHDLARAPVPAEARSPAPAPRVDPIPTPTPTIPIPIEIDAPPVATVRARPEAPRFAVTGIVRDRVWGVVPGAYATVLTPEGLPIAGAWCNGAGRFRVELTSAGPHALRVEAQGYATHDGPVRVPGDVVVSLAPASAVRGRVIAADDGRGVAKIMVALVARGALGAPGLERVATSDDAGEFQISGAAPGLHDITVRSEDWVAQSVGAIAVPWGEDVTEVVVRVESGLVLAGRVESDAEDFCRHGSVELSASHAAPRRVDFEDRREVVFGGLTAGAYVPTVHCAEGRVRAFERVELSASKRDLVWSIASGSTIVGDLRDQAGDPIENVSIALVASGGGRAEGLSGPGGRFELRGVLAGPHRFVVAGARDIEPRGIDGPTPWPIQVYADRGARVVGRALSTDLEPLAHFVVTLKKHGRASTDPGGRFVFTDVAPGEYEVIVTHPERSSTDEAVPLETILAEAGCTVTATIVAPVRLARIRGRAVDSDGRPVSGVVITARRLGERTPRSKPVRLGSDRVVSDGEGAFEIRGLPEGGYVIDGQAPGRAEGRVEAWTGDDVTLEMESVARVVGAVRRADGRALAAFHVRISNDDYEASERFYARDGRFAFADVPYGDYTISVSSDGAFGEVRQSIERTVVEVSEPIVIGGGHELSGRLVRFGSGEGVSGTIAYRGRPRAVGADGHFAISGVAPDVATLLLAPTGQAPIVLRVEMPDAAHDVGAIAIPPPGLSERFGFSLQPAVGSMHIGEVVPGGPAFDVGLPSQATVRALVVDRSSAEVTLADGQRVTIRARE